VTNEELNQAYAEQLAHRRAANCYDIHEAAQAIALQLGLNGYRTEKLREDMGQAAFDGALTVRSPGGHDQYAPTSPPKTTYGFDSLTTPDDVNKWAAERRFTWCWLSEPQATTPSPAPVMTPELQAAPAKRRTLWHVVTPYIVETMQAGQYATAKQLFKALQEKAGPGSPFDRGTGNNLGSLYVRETSDTLALSTLQNRLPTLKAAAKK